MKHAEGLKLGHHIPVPSYYQLNLEKKISDVRSGCRRGKNGSNQGGQSYVGACRLSHLIFVKTIKCKGFVVCYTY